jgi:FMN phosphatase YigB (HAD superfamily)
VEADIRPAKAIGWSAALVRSSAAGSDGAADFEFDRMEELTRFVLG